VAISTSAAKEELAKNKGADVFVVSRDAASLKASEGTCDMILNTVAAPHDLKLYLPLLKKNGVLVQLGLVTEPHEVYQLPELIMKRKSIAGSFIGGIAATQEVVDLCFKHGIYPDCETITADKLDWAWEQLGSNSGGLRYVVDIKRSLENKAFVPT